METDEFVAPIPNVVATIPGATDEAVVLGNHRDAWVFGAADPNSGTAAMLEVGAYHRTWPDWHLGPENALRAHEMVRGGLFVPIHWGLWNLAMHGWTEPVERILVEAVGRYESLTGDFESEAELFGLVGARMDAGA